VLFGSIQLDLDFSYILVLALLLVPFIILNSLVFGPFMKMLAERHERLEGALEKASRRLDEAEDKARAFDEKIQSATQRGVDIRNQIRADAQKAMNARIDAEKATLQKRLDAALAEIKGAHGAARAQAEAEGKRLAEATAAKLLGRTL
jgi:F0F1-type ATP synthase membrane subunit b/b'